MEKEHKTKGLWSIVLVELTNYCNFSCSFCPSDSIKRKRTMMPRELWEKILTELGDKKMANTVFFNLLGEPLLHKDIFDAVRFANDRGLRVSIYTNGALLDEERSEKLLDSLKKGRIVLSMQDITPGDFKRRCRSALSWEEYLKRLEDFIRKAEKRGISVQVHCLADIGHRGWDLFRIFKNQREIQAVYERWRALLGDGKTKRINIFNPTGIYPLGKYASFFVKHKGSWDNEYIPDDMEVVPRDRGYCALMTDTFAVLADGTCTYCCGDFEGKLNLGNAAVDSLEDIYYGKKSAALREAQGKGILLDDRCKACRGYLIYKKSKKRVASRNLLAEYYFFADHLKEYGLKSALRKTLENVKRRIGMD